MAKEFTLKGIIKFLDQGASQTIKKVDQEVMTLKNNTRKISGGFRDFNQGLAVVGGAGVIAGAGLAKAIKTSAVFEQQMARVGALSRATDEQMSLLTNTAKQLGATTEFTATQAGQGLEFLALAGFKAKDAVNTLPIILDTAAAGALDLGRASDIVTDSMSALGTAFNNKFSTPAAKAARLADVMSLAQAKSNTNIEQLGEAIKFGGGALAGFGIPMTQIIASMGKLADAGLKGSLGGTALTNMFNKLTKPSKDVRNAMNILGVDMSKLPLNDVAKTTGILGTALDKITDPVQRQTVAIEVFGQRGIRAFNALKNAGPDALRTLTKELDASTGSAKRIADRQRATFEGQTKAFASAVEGVLIEVGDFFTKNEKDVLPAFRGLVSFIQDLGRAFQFVNMTAKDQNKAMAGMSERSKGLITFAQGFKDGISEAFTTIKETFKDVKDALADILPEGENGLKMIGKWIAKGAVLMAVMAPLILGFVTFSFALGSVVTGFGGLVSMASGSLGILKQVGTLIFAMDKAILKFAGNVLMKIPGVTKMFGLLKSGMMLLGGFMKGALLTAFGLIKTAVVKLSAVLLANPIGLMIAGVVALIAAGWLLWKNWDSIVSLLKSAWMGLLETFQFFVNWIKNASIGEIIIKTILFPIRAALEPILQMVKLLAGSSIGKKLLGAGGADFIKGIADNLSLFNTEQPLTEQKSDSVQAAARQALEGRVETKRLSMPQSAEPQVNVNVPAPVVELTNENVTNIDGQMVERSMTKRKMARTERAGMNAKNPKDRQLQNQGGFAAGFNR